MNIVKIYTPDGSNLLYEFGVTEEKVKYGTRKYGMGKYGESVNNGRTLSADFVSDGDCSCSELQAGSLSVSVKSREILSIPEKSKLKLFDFGGALLGSFEVETAQRISKTTYNISCYDYLGVAENTACHGFYIVSKPLKEFAKALRDMGIPIWVEEAIQDDLIDGEALPGAFTIREVLQYIALAYDYAITTVGVDGILIKAKNTSETFEYGLSDLKEGVSIDKNSENVDFLRISKTKIDMETVTSDTFAFVGYVELSDADYTTVRISPYGNNPINPEFPQVTLEESLSSLIKSASNKLAKKAQTQTITSVDLGWRIFRGYINGELTYYKVSEYATAEIGVDNDVIVKIDNIRFRELVELSLATNNVTELSKTSSDGTENALLVIGASFSEEQISEEYTQVKFKDGEKSVLFETPFVSEKMTDNLYLRYTKPLMVNFSCKYRGEKQHSVIMLPGVYDEEPITAIIEDVTISYGAQKLWADITARVIS